MIKQSERLTIAIEEATLGTAIGEQPSMQYASTR